MEFVDLNSDNERLENPINNDKNENPIDNDKNENPIDNDKNEKPIDNDKNEKPIDNNNIEKFIDNNKNKKTDEKNKKHIDNKPVIYNIYMLYVNLNSNTISNADTNIDNIAKYESQLFTNKLVYVCLLSYILWNYSMSDLLVPLNSPILIISFVLFFFGYPLSLCPIVLLYRK